MKSIIDVRDISKRYFIKKNEPYLSLRDSISSLFSNSLNRKSQSLSFWALNHITFDVVPGETVGIIGKNGAGKSTLLKILSRITPPTSGHISIHGRVASLLEVGTGFHNELTGKENIILNGSILGLKRKEIISRFDEMVEFSGVENFLNTPLKHYSSGMQLRLAFAVAAFLEPEILLIDEVLAVGDAEFQKKCINKMKNVTDSGRTILFVSHDLNAVQTLCKKSIFLESGKIKNIASTNEIIAEYLKQQNVHNFWEQNAIKELPHFTFITVALKGEQPTLILEVEFILKTRVSMASSIIVFNISNKMGNTLGQAIPKEEPFIKLKPNEELNLRTEILLEGFIPDDYYLSAWIGSNHNQTYDWQKECLMFSITKSPQKGRVFPHSSNNGNLVFKSKLVV